ncbi:Rieske (2Fe-2S) protein [Streptomyces fructofermentans]|uniref:Cytochrome bc1 complex Rieske iron-sulfur subunit n=1 Tax=Streptomyces fructofermentans TaxID=152141 RepID=A0A918KE59_9ACTN|nr:Rieske (2Fe-2S) protein [Streptomyces fructofermentans]GGX60374.1 (Fe-S)-binding protein [Streptomyces fructofermentans]
MSARPSASRRTVLRGAAAAPVAGLGPGLAACSPGAGGSPSSGPTGPVDLGAASEVPKGGARLYREQKVVVSRARDGSYGAFSSVCTHAGCPIDRLEGTELVCPCHGSRFDATTGEVRQEPATVPLAKLSVTERDGRLVAGPEA